MTAIFGAEFAPILTRTVIDLGPEGSEYQLEREIRWRADVTDPNDMRAIWCRAALALGATEEEAATAFLRNDLDSWSLVVDRGRGIKPQTRVLWTSPQPVWWGRRDVATGALCAHVWGPK